jgi:hypothetical protein
MGKLAAMHNISLNIGIEARVIGMFRCRAPSQGHSELRLDNVLITPRAKVRNQPAYNCAKGNERKNSKTTRGMQQWRRVDQEVG